MKFKKRIVLFCDGTWNEITSDRATHILRLSQAVAPTAADGVPQYVFYQEGVGTGRGSNGFAKVTDKILGGAFGWGLHENLTEVYRQLVYWYEPGDEIYIFGFSRGAYTARSLGGLIRRVGIIPRTHLSRLEEVVYEYRRRDKPAKSDDPYFLAKRYELSPLTATSQADLNWRREQGDTKSIFLRLTYVGVFDTVGALGLPGFVGFTAKIFNKKYQFHDTALSHMVRAARHAVAIDEQRLAYAPALWSNLDRLNGETTGNERPYLQNWFPGNHGVIGGSGQAPELARCSAAWIVEGARTMGLDFDRNILASMVEHANPTHPVPEGFVPPALNTMLGRRVLKFRMQLQNASDLSKAAIIRYQTLPDYRPPALRSLADFISKISGGEVEEAPIEEPSQKEVA